MSDQALTISELNLYIKDVINAGFPQALWICGEIQGFTRNKNKNHIFFSLIEKTEEGKEIKSCIEAVIWSGKKAYLQHVLDKSGNPFELKDDIEVKLLCKVDYYPPHGAVRLVVEGIDPVYTLGKLAQEKQKLIKLLKEKGVLDQNKKLDLSPVPLQIGVITSDDSAAYNDFLSELKKSGFGFKIYLRNSLMQGKKVEADVSQALMQLQKIENLDAIVITRGGGSTADLSCFDNQLIAETIAKCRLPVLTGIGHEIDTSIADLAAHTFAKTPTAIAQFLVGRAQQFIDQLNDHLDAVIRSSEQTVENRKKILHQKALIVKTATLEFMSDHSQKIARVRETLKNKAFYLLESQKKLSLQWKDALKRTLKSRIEKETQTLKHFHKVINIVRPERILKRGFSLTRGQDGKVIKNISQISKGSLIKTYFVDGVAQSKVENIEEVPNGKE